MDDPGVVQPDRRAGDHGRVTVMIAVENTEGSVAVVREAHRLLGDDADYFVVNVGASQYASVRWAATYPVGMPGTWLPLLPLENDLLEDDRPDAAKRAEGRAADLAAEGSLDDATPIGEVGDPATAIMRAAHEHAADIVVIGSHQRGWFGRLFATSVEKNVLREADFAVMVVKHP